MLGPKGQLPPPPPQDLRPWYYRNWFLIPAFVLGWPITPLSIVWPLWAVLIIRSPWHNSIISGALAWAMLLTGGFELVRLVESNPGAAISRLAPGVMLTVVTQMLWSRHKQALPAASPVGVEDSPADTSPGESPPHPSDGHAVDGHASAEGDTPPVRRTRVPRRSPRRRGARSGRRPPR